MTALRSPGVHDRIFLGGMVTGRPVHRVTVRVPKGHVLTGMAHVPKDLVATVTVRGQGAHAPTARALRDQVATAMVRGPTVHAPRDRDLRRPEETVRGRMDPIAIAEKEKRDANRLNAIGSQMVIESSNPAVMGT